jgi:hypothetical protein
MRCRTGVRAGLRSAGGQGHGCAQIPGIEPELRDAEQAERFLPGPGPGVPPSAASVLEWPLLHTDPRRSRKGSAGAESQVFNVGVMAFLALVVRFGYCASNGLRWHLAV